MKPAYGFPIRSRTTPNRRGWTRKLVTREEQRNRARANFLEAHRKLVLAQDEIERAGRILSELNKEEQPA